MPEGDSVRRLAQRLHAALADRQLVATDFRVPRHATVDLAGRRVLEVRSRGKHLLMRVEGGTTVHSHLRMQGSWTVLAAGRRLPARLGPEVRAALSFDDGRTAVALRMPVLDVLPTAREDDVVGHLGPDLLDPGFGAADADEGVRRLAAGPATPVVQALLDQRTVAGIGNLWAVETLFLRGVDPQTPVGALAEVDLAAAVALAQRMMRYAMVHRGMVTTGDTRPGRTHWVYGRAGRPCRRCGTAVAFRPGGTVTGGPRDRETWWCPHCQPLRCAVPATPGTVRA